MGLAYRVDEAAGIVLEQWSGSVFARDFADHLDRMLCDVRVLACRGNLADITACELRFSGEKLSHLTRDTLGPALDGTQRKVALVVRGPVQVGMARQFQVLAEAFAEVELFATVAAARAWILR